MSKTNKIILGILAVLVIIFFVIRGTTMNKKTDDSGEVIKIGVSVCQTGSCAEWGENTIKGAQLAVKENNSNPKNKKLELVIEDSREDNITNAISSYEKLKSQGIKFFITPTWTPAALALAPIISKDDVVAIAVSVGVRDYNEAGENIFNTWPNDDEGSKYLARYVKSQNINTIAIISSKQPWEQIQGNAFESEFIKQGGNVVYKTEPQLGEKNFKTIAADIINKKAEAVFYSNLSNSGIAAKDLKTLGYSGKQFAVLMDQTRLDQASGSLNGTIYVQSPEAEKTFIDSYKKEYNEEPKVSSDTGYDAVMWLASAINNTNMITPKNISQIMNSMETLTNTANGTLRFNGKGAVLRNPALWVVNNEKLEKLF